MKKEDSHHSHLFTIILIGALSGITFLSIFTISSPDVAATSPVVIQPPAVQVPSGWGPSGPVYGPINPPPGASQLQPPGRVGGRTPTRTSASGGFAAGYLLYNLLNNFMGGCNPPPPVLAPYVPPTGQLQPPPVYTPAGSSTTGTGSTDPEPADPPTALEEFENRINAGVQLSQSSQPRNRGSCVLAWPDAHYDVRAVFHSGISCAEVQQETAQGRRVRGFSINEGFPIDAPGMVGIPSAMPVTCKSDQCTTSTNLPGFCNPYAQAVNHLQLVPVAPINTPNDFYAALTDIQNYMSQQYPHLTLGYSPFQQMILNIVLNGPINDDNLHLRTLFFSSRPSCASIIMNTMDCECIPRGQTGGGNTKIIKGGSTGKSSSGTTTPGTTSPGTTAPGTTSPGQTAPRPSWWKRFFGWMIGSGGVVALTTPPPTGTTGVGCDGDSKTPGCQPGACGNGLYCKTSSCTCQPNCGNSKIDIGEQCDPPSTPCTDAKGIQGTCSTTCQCPTNTLPDKQGGD